MGQTETIYDITPIPLFPYVPGFWIWIGLVTFGIISALVVLRIRARAAHKPKTLDAYVLLQTELERIRGKIVLGQSDPSLFQRASLLVKRYLSLSLKEDLPALAPREIQALSQKSTRKTLRELLESLFQLENVKYQPHVDSTSATQILDRILSLVKGFHQEELEQ